MKKTITPKRKVCFVITSFIHYSRSILILEELRTRKDVELYIIVGGTAILSKYSASSAYVRKILEQDGYKNIYELHFNLEGDDAIVKTKTIGLGVIEFASIYNHIKPDMVVIRGDRFEIFAAAIAAANMNIPIAHIEGGDVSGTIDESLRHAITKLSHIHFTTNDEAKERVIRMGENKDYVFNFGSPEVEVVSKMPLKADRVNLEETGSGAKLDPSKEFLMVMYHPVTTELDKIGENVRTLLNAVHKTKMPTIWFWPNFDAGAEQISHELRVFKEHVKDHRIRFMRYLPPKDFIWLLRRTSCLVGNSSAGIKETSFLGVPVIDVGTRQNGRLSSSNVVKVGYNEAKIVEAIKNQVKNGRYPVSDIYKGEDTAKKIAEKIATAKLYVQKKFE
ncbi:MAG: UDP-N-acetylglucosamine 2-epimerase [Candidatus Paceibacterota bacterium]|jgi:UDP-hydrolysing UDP-N-acetyl-D-glucosamine 2-epimerase